MIVKEVLIRLKYWELFNRDLKPQIRCDKWNEIVEADNAMLHLNSRRLIFKNYRLDRRSRDIKIQTSEGLDGAIKLAPTALKILQESKIPKQIEGPKEKPKPP